MAEMSKTEDGTEAAGLLGRASAGRPRAMAGTATGRRPATATGTTSRVG